MDSDQSAALDARYGVARRRSFDRRFAWGAVAVLLLAGAGFLLFSGWHTASQVEVQDIGTPDRDDHSISLKYQVTGPARAEVACAVEAQNTSKATVGWKVVEVPRSSRRTHTITTKLVTTTPATAASVRECWVVR